VGTKLGTVEKREKTRLLLAGQQVPPKAALDKALEVVPGGGAIRTPVLIPLKLLKTLDAQNAENGTYTPFEYATSTRVFRSMGYGLYVRCAALHNTCIMKVSSSVVLSAVLSAMFAIACPSFGQSSRALLSVEGLGLPENETIIAYNISTWGVAFLAVCKVPPSWEIKAEKYMDPEGMLHGRSDVHGEPLRELHQMFLVDVYSYQPLPKGDPKGEYHPASFSGWIEVGTQSSEHGKRRTLRSTNFKLTPATRCPDPPAPEP
jgi:hypothetical protein